MPPEISHENESYSVTEIAAAAALSAAAIGIAIASRGKLTSLVRGASAVAPEVETAGAAAGAELNSLAALGKQFQFHETGRLASGTHRVSWDELVQSFGHTPERRLLLERFQPIARDLKAAKIDTVEIGGSFASTKAAPKDIDFVWNNQQKGFSPLRLRWRNPELVTAETDALQYRGLHNVNGAKGSHYPDALQFLRKEKIEPKINFDASNLKSHEDFVALGEARRLARIEAAKIEEAMKEAGTLHRNGLLQLDLSLSLIHI